MHGSSSLKFFKLILARTFKVWDSDRKSGLSQHPSGREQFFVTYPYEVSELTEVLCVVVLNLLPYNYNRSNTGRNSLQCCFISKNQYFRPLTSPLHGYTPLPIVHPSRSVYTQSPSLLKFAYTITCSFLSDFSQIFTVVSIHILLHFKYIKKYWKLYDLGRPIPLSMEPKQL